MQKIFVLDTNVLLHNAESLESFGDNEVVLPLAVLEELDKFKKSTDELGRNARWVIRRLDTLRKKGNLHDGVPLGNGGSLKIMLDSDCDMDVPGLENTTDNRILKTAYILSKKSEKTVIFISKDINARVKANALGLIAEDFEKQKINFDEMYKGYREVKVSQELFNRFLTSEEIEADELNLLVNEFVLLKTENGTNNKNEMLARCIKPHTISHLARNRETAWNITARNREQRMALELLLDPKVQIVTLVGRAGTGKTLLALAAALEEALKNRRYEGIVVTRPIIPFGRDIGYLPGGKEEKLTHWMQPIFDNLGLLLRGSNITFFLGEKHKKNGKLTLQEKIQSIIDSNVLVLEALTYIRGRSIPGQFVIVDEAQNLTPHEVKTIISRAGEDTKMILTGDPYQIDNPYLDSSSNGLTYAAERFKGQPIHGHITLEKSERSKLAALAAELL